MIFECVGVRCAISGGGIANVVLHRHLRKFYFPIIYVRFEGILELHLVEMRVMYVQVR